MDGPAAPLCTNKWPEASSSFNLLSRIVEGGKGSEETQLEGCSGPELLTLAWNLRCGDSAARAPGSCA